MTWEELVEQIMKLPEEQRKLPVQVIKPKNYEDIDEALPGFSFDLVKNFGFYGVRSTHNNKYCPDDPVLLVDHNPFGEDGAIAYEWNLEEDGRASDEFTPIYGKDGKTNVNDQLNPDQEEHPKKLIDILKHRMKKIDESEY